MESRLWLTAGSAAVALHAATWLAVNRPPAPVAPRYLQFSVVDVQFAVAPARTVGAPASRRRKPRRERPKPRHLARRHMPARPRTALPSPQLAKSAAAAPAPTAAPEPYVEPNYGAAYLHNPPPIYPLMARQRGISGRVVIEAEVTADGRCGAAHVLQSSGHEILDHTALAAVMKWRFVPAARNGHPVTATVTIPLNFKLQGEG